MANIEGTNGCSFYFIDSNGIGRLARILATEQHMFLPQVSDPEFTTQTHADVPWTEKSDKLEYKGWDGNNHTITLNATLGVGAIEVTVEEDGKDKPTNDFGVKDWDGSDWRVIIQRRVQSGHEPTVTLERRNI